MSTYKARKSAAERFGISTQKLLSTTALVAAGAAALLPGAVNAKDVGDYDVWQFENTQASDSSLGYVEYRGDTIIDNLVQEDIGKLGHVHLDARLTVATGIEAGPMHILGKLTSTGEVKILDVNGFLFGKNSVVDTQGFAAIGGSIKNANSFLTDGKLEIDVAEDASITIEEGAMINVGQAGLAAFVAPFITNSGIINAKMGTVEMAAGEAVTLDLYGDSLVELVVEGELADALIENKGTINAEGGRVQMTALAAKDAVDNIINVDGVVTVASATQVGGKIVLSGGSKGVVNVEGSMDASGTDGGDINITGQNVNVAEAAEMKADGGNGADGNGDGGDVIFVADNAAIFRGKITAKGGANGGDGGYVDTSGLNYIDITGDVDVSAANGGAGLWYIDPRDLEIGTFTDNTSGNGTIGNPFRPNSGSSSGNRSFLNVASVNAALTGGSNVYITTIGSPSGSGDGDVEIDATILKSGGGDAKLTIDALSSIFFTGGTGISSTVGALDLDFNAGDSINANRAIDTNGGNVDFDAGDDITISTMMLTKGGNVNLLAGGGGNDDVFINADVKTAGGDFFASAGDDVRVNATIDTSRTTAGTSGDITLKALGAGFSEVEISSTGKLLVTDNGIPGVFEGNVLIEAEDLVIDTTSGTKIDAADGFNDGDVTIRRSTSGDISLGAAGAGMNISQGELAAIDAENLTVGGANTSEINVEDVNTTTATISKLVHLITDFNTGGGDDVNFAGVNVFNSLKVDADDDIIFDDGAKIEVLTGDATFTGDTNAGTVGDFNMGENALIDSNGNNVIVSSLNVLMEDDSEINTEGGDVSITARDDFASNDGNVTLQGDSAIDADGGSILIDNEGVFTGGVDSLITHTTGTITVNQNRGTAGGASLQNVIDAMANSGTGQNTLFSDSSTYNENLTINQANLKIDGDNTVIIGNGVDPTISVEVSNFGLDPVIVDAGGAAYGLVAADAGANGLDVDGNTFRNSTVAGIKVSNTTGGTSLIQNNIFEASSTRGVEVAGLSGGSVVDIEGNTMGSDGKVVNGVHATGAITGAGTQLNITKGNTIDSTGDGVLLSDALSAQGQLNVDDATITANVDGIKLTQGVSGAVVNVTNSDIAGRSNGIEFSKNVVGSTVNISDNARVEGTNDDRAGDAIDFRGLIISSNVDINRNELVRGADDAIQVIGGISGGTFDVVGNTQITGLDGDGINLLSAASFGGDGVRSIRDGAVVTITDNAITGTGPDNDTHNPGGTGDGVLVSGQVADASTVTIQRNTITGYDEGVNFNGKITGASTVDISDANTINGTTGNGIGFAGIDGASTVDIKNNTSITGGLNGIDFGAGSPSVEGDADVEISGNALVSGGVHGISFADDVTGTGTTVLIKQNTQITGVSEDGVNFDGKVSAGADVNISENDIDGDENGVSFSGIDGATATIAENTIDADDGVGVLFGAGSPSLTGGALVDVIKNIITASDDGIRADDEINGASVLQINSNTITAGSEGIDFMKAISAASRITLGSYWGGGFLNNTINADDSGIVFRDAVTGSMVHASGFDIDADDGDAVRFEGEIGGASNVTFGAAVGRIIATGQQWASSFSNTATGSDSGFVFEENLTGNSRVNITKTTITGEDGDGVRIEKEVNGGTIVRLARNIIDGQDGQGVLVEGHVDGGTVNIDSGTVAVAVAGLGGLSVTGTGGNTITGSENGVEFNGIVNNSGVNIKDNTLIDGNGGDGVLFNEGSASIDGSNVTISGNTSIVGSDNGIRAEDEVTGSSVTIDDNDSIEGEGGDGIVFEDEVNGSSTVNITNNDNIIGSDDGIDFEDVVTNSTVNISGNNDGIQANNHGISFDDDISGSDIDIHDNIIDANNDNLFVGAGIYFGGTIDTSTVNIGNGSRGSDPSNYITVAGGGDDDTDGIYFAKDVGTGANINIKGNRIGYTGTPGGSNAGQAEEAIKGDGIEFAGEVNGNAIVDIGDNWIKADGNGSGSDGDGVVFSGAIGDTASVLVGGAGDGNIINAADDGIETNGVTGGTLTMSNNTINAGDNGVEMNGASPSISGGAVVNFVGNTVDVGGDGYYVDDEITGAGTTLNVKNNDIEADDDGVDIDNVNNGATVNVGGPGGSDGNYIRAAGNGIEFDAGVDATVLVQKNRISAGEDGVNVRDSDPGHVTGVDNGALVSILDNRIGSQGSDTIGDDGVDFDDSITGNSTVNISRNKIGRSGAKVGDDGIDIDSITGGATVNIKDNIDIRAADNGIEVNGPVNGGATVNITGNNHGIHSDDHGVVFYSDISGNATLNIHDNIIGANEDRNAVGSGIWFGGKIKTATINIGDGTFGSFTGGASNIIRVDGNNGGGGVSNLDAIHFDKDIEDDAVINIDGNRLGYFANCVGCSLTPEQLADDGIEFKGKVEDNANVKITDNYIRAKDDGIQFSNDIEDDARILIGGHNDDNWINAWDNGISFLDVVEGHSKVEISYADINAGNNGIYFKGNTSNHEHDYADPEEILIKKSKIVGGNNGILFEGKASHGRHDIMIRDNYKIVGNGGDGIRHEGDIDDAELTIKHNDEIFGKYDGIDIIGYFTDDAAIRIHGNKDIDTDRDDGISVYQYGGAGGVDLEIDHNHVHWTGDDGIFVHNVRGANIHDNEVHHTGRRGGEDGHGIYVSNSDYADIINNTLWDIDAHGIYVNPSDYVDINYNQIGGWISGWGWRDGARWDGIRIKQSDHADIKHNYIYKVGDDGVHVEDSDYAYIHWNEIRRTGQSNSDGEGVQVGDDSDYATIDMNVFEYIGDDAVDIDGGYGHVVDGNYIYKTGDDGIDIDGGYHITINNNIIEFVDEDGVDADHVYDLDITNNWIAWAKDDGVDVDNSKYVYIAGNGIDYSGDNGIQAHNSANVHIHDNDIYYAGRDGIHAGYIYDYGNSYYGTSNGFALKITKNKVDHVGDDGIEAHDSGRTLIARNRVQDVGLYGHLYGIHYRGHEYNFHDGEETGGGHYSRHNNFHFKGGDDYGADGIHARNIEAGDISVSKLQLNDGYFGFNPYEYDLIIKGNRVRRTADDGIEVVGNQYWGYNPYAGKHGSEYQYGTGRTLIAKNRVQDAGYDDYDHSYYNPYGFYFFKNGSEDGYGADGIHVRGVFDNREGQPRPVRLAGGGEGGFYGYAVDVLGNIVRRTEDDGIEVRDSESTLIQYNRVRKAGYIDSIFDYKTRDYRNGADGIHVTNVYGSLGSLPGISTDYGFSPYAVVIDHNKVRLTADDGIEVAYAGRTRISNNRVRKAGYATYGDYGYYYSGGDYRYGADGIHVRGITNIYDGPYRGDIALLDGPGYYGPGYGKHYDIEIVGNNIKRVTSDGIEVRAKKQRGGQNGGGCEGFGESCEQTTAFIGNGYYGRNTTDLLVERNDIMDAGDNGILLVADKKRRSRNFAQYDEGYSERGYGGGYGDYGYYYKGFFNSDIFDNTVENSGSNGLHVKGYGHGDVVLKGNTFINNPVGARFESGRIDVSDKERPNSFIVTPDYELPEGYDYVTGMQFELAKKYKPTSLTIVDETLGGTIFRGFINRPVGEAYYVRFEDGAILDKDGNVIVIDGTMANWDGVIPTNFGNKLPANVLKAIEDRLWDADDPLKNGRGQIFVGMVADEALTIDNVEDFFRRFGPVGGGLSGLNLTVTGLPPVNLPTQNLAGITPFAGGEGEDVAGIEPAAGDDGEGLQDIEPAAGGEQAGCWGDILNAAADGGSVNYSFTGSVEETLADASACGSQTL